jgi:hypothetical protein
VGRSPQPLLRASSYFTPVHLDSGYSLHPHKSVGEDVFNNR